MSIDDLERTHIMANQVIFDIGWVVDKTHVYTMEGQ